MCRHAAWLGPPLHPRLADLRPRARPAAAVVRAAACSGTACSTPTASAWAGTTRARAGPVRYRRSVPIWTDANLRRARRVVAVDLPASPPYGRRPPACRSRSRAPRRSPTGGGCSATTGAIERLTRSRPARARAGRCAAIPDAGAPVRLGAGCARSPLARLRPATPLADGLAAVVGRRPPPRPRPAQPARLRRRVARRHRLGRHPLRPDGRRRAGRQRAARRPPGWRPVPDRSLCTADPRGVRVSRCERTPRVAPTTRVRRATMIDHLDRRRPAAGAARRTSAPG